MKKGNLVTRLGLAALIFTAPAAFAQDIHFTQFDMQPLVVNPAFTGMFFGKVRANAIYRNQWKSVTVPYVTYGASVDLPIKTEDNGYLAAGLQMFKDQAGDGNLSNFTGLASISYHKLFGEVSNDDYKGSDLAIGLQGGYAQKSIDLSKLYFGDEFVNGSFVPGTTQEYKLGLGNSVNYYVVNAGLCFSSATSSRFSYIVGLAANNINQPNDAILKKKNSDVGLAMRYTGELGFIMKVGDKLSLQPAVFYQTQASASELIFGNEFHLALTNEYGDINFTPAVFVGGWMRNGDAAMITAGVEFSNIRVGLGYDINTSSLNNATNGNGGFEIALKYISPYSIARRRTIPCTRF